MVRKGFREHLAEYREKVADNRLARYIEAFDDRGLHVVAKECNPTPTVVAGPSFSYKPGTVVLLASNTGHPGERIIGDAPAGRKGASAWARRVSYSGVPADAVCPVPRTGYEYLGLLYESGSRTLTACVYADGTFDRAIRQHVHAVGISGVSTGLAQAYRVGSTTKVVWPANISGNLAILTWDCDEGGAGTFASLDTGIDNSALLAVIGSDFYVVLFDSFASPNEVRLWKTTAALGAPVEITPEWQDPDSDRWGFGSIACTANRILYEATDLDSPSGTAEDWLSHQAGPGSWTFTGGTSANQEAHGYATPGRPVAAGSVRYHGGAYGSAGPGSLTIVSSTGSSEARRSPQAWGLPNDDANVSPNPARTEVAVYPLDTDKLLRLTLEDRSNEAFDAENCEPPWIAVSVHPTIGSRPVAMLCRN